MGSNLHIWPRNRTQGEQNGCLTCPCSGSREFSTAWEDAMENSTPSVAAAWSLSFDDLLFVRSFPTASRLGCAVQLLHFRLHAGFFDDWAEVGSEVLRHVADQTETDARHAADYRLGNRTARRHHAMIVDREGFARLSEQGRVLLDIVRMIAYRAETRMMPAVAGAQGSKTRPRRPLASCSRRTPTSSPTRRTASCGCASSAPQATPPTPPSRGCSTSSTGRARSSPEPPSDGNGSGKSGS